MSTAARHITGIPVSRRCYSATAGVLPHTCLCTIACYLHTHCMTICASTCDGLLLFCWVAQGISLTLCLRLGVLGWLMSMLPLLQHIKPDCVKWWSLLSLCLCCQPWCSQASDLRVCGVRSVLKREGGSSGLGLVLVPIFVAASCTHYMHMPGVTNPLLN